MKIHLFIIIGHHLMDNGVIDTTCLKYHLPLLILSAGTTRYLSHQLKCSFIGSKVRIVKHGVGIENTYHTHMVEIQSFGYHLRTNEDIRLALFKIHDNLFVGAASTRGIQVHTCNGCFWKDCFYIVFYLFCSKTSIDYFCTLACRARTRQHIGIATIMTSKLINAFVIR